MHTCYLTTITTQFQRPNDFFWLLYAPTANRSPILNSSFPTFWWEQRQLYYDIPLLNFIWQYSHLFHLAILCIFCFDSCPALLTLPISLNSSCLSLTSLNVFSTSASSSCFHCIFFYLWLASFFKIHSLSLCLTVYLCISPTLLSLLYLFLNLDSGER